MLQETLDIFGEYATDDLDQWLTKVINGEHTSQILILYGPGGSGKTYIARKLMELIPSSIMLYEPLNKTTDRLMVDHSLVVFDNIEWKTRTVDYILSRAQPTTISIRQLYQDSLKQIYINCNIVITSISLPNRDDLLDRCLIVETKRHVLI